MDFKLLKIYLKLGKFLAITPPFEIHKTNKFQKLHRILMIILTGIGVGISVYYRNFYQEYDLAKITVCFLVDFFLFAFNFRVIVQSSKLKKWSKIVFALKQTSCLIINYKDKQNEWWLYLMGEIIFWAITLSSTYYWMGVIGASVQLSRYGVEILENYILFCNSLFIHTILAMIHRRYKGLRKYTETKFPKSENLVQLSRLACTLKELIDNFNDMFGYSLLLNIAFVTLQFLNYLDYNFRTKQYGFGNIAEVITVEVLVVFLFFIPTVMIVWKCDNIVEESEKIAFLAFRITLGTTDLKEQDRLNRFCEIFDKCKPEFNAARFFSIGRDTILSIFGTAATFLIVLVTYKA